MLGALPRPLAGLIQATVQFLVVLTYVPEMDHGVLQVVVEDQLRFWSKFRASAIAWAVVR